MAVTVSPGDMAENAIIHRLFSASLEIHSALQLVHDDPATQLLHHAIDDLDRAIKQARDQAFGQLFPLRPRNEPVPFPTTRDASSNVTSGACFPRAAAA